MDIRTVSGPNHEIRAAMPKMAASAGSSHPWASLVLMVAMICAVVAAVDWAVQWVVPIRHLREAADGIADLRRGDPITLVVGSSHARTFHVLGQELSRKTARSGELVAIPLEAGKLTSYRWLLEHRVLPLVDEKDNTGSRVRGRLRNFVLLTEWWDSCEESPNVYWNLPGRAWDLETYLRDVARNGLTTYNRNFLQYHVTRSLGFSALVGDRLKRRLVRNLRLALLGGPPESVSRRWYAANVAQARSMVEGGDSCIGATDQMQALEAIVQEARIRGLNVRIVLFPRMPVTITPEAEITTLRRFREMVEDVARRHDATVLDLTLASPLESSDFMDDFDHVDAEGNQKFAEWALAGPFSDLLRASSDGPMSGAGAR
jgi:hypothetical protein